MLPTSLVSLSREQAWRHLAGQSSNLKRTVHPPPPPPGSLCRLWALKRFQSRKHFSYTQYSKAYFPFVSFPPLSLLFLFIFIFYKTGEKSELDWGEVTHFSTKVQNCLQKAKLGVLTTGLPSQASLSPDVLQIRLGIHSGSRPTRWGGEASFSPCPGGERASS